MESRERDITGNRRTAVTMLLSCYADVTHSGNRDVAGQHTERTACEDEISKLNTASIESSGGENIVFELREIVY
jgi:hypothetical protein